MSAEQDNFEELRRLIAIKRHEQPPPGYFHNFSHQVIARIQAGEPAADESWLGRWFGGPSWLSNLWTGFEAKPIVAGAFGLGVCSLLVVGLVSSERIDANPGVFAPVPEAPQGSFAIAPSQSVGSLFERSAADHTATGAVYTAQSRSSIFEEIQRPRVQAVSFSPSN
jgi:hypothetical protein